MKIPATIPSFSDSDINFILSQFEDILRGNSFLSMGKHVELFEELFAKFIGVTEAVACSSGTSALELIFRSIGIEDKEVIIPSNTFIATANAVINAGGRPVFSDCNFDMCMSYDDVMARVTTKTRAICHVHIGGLVTRDAVRIAQFCSDNGIHFVEDACQAHGAGIDQKKAGSLGTAGAFSFFSTKVMTTGEGGMVTTNRADLAEKMKSIREFGKVKTGIYVNFHKFMGYNWRMPEVAALLGLRQLASVPDFIERRVEIADRYAEALAGIDEIQFVRPDARENYNGFKFIILMPPNTREFMHKALQESGVSPSGYVYEFPLHKMPVFPEHNEIILKNTERVCAQHLCLPIFPSMKPEEVEYVIESFLAILPKALKQHYP